MEIDAQYDKALTRTNSILGNDNQNNYTNDEDNILGGFGKNIVQNQN